MDSRSERPEILLPSAPEDFLRYLPFLYQDENETVPLRKIGFHLCTQAGPSASVPGMTLSPADRDTRFLIEFSLYWDYDIQHMYDLEQIWVFVGGDGSLRGLWNSFHGFVLDAFGLPAMVHRRDGRPMLYIQPGKHAPLADPALFGLHKDFRASLREQAGGGLLIPPFLADVLRTTPELDDRIRRHIRKSLTFEPSGRYVPVPVTPDMLCPTGELLALIPSFVDESIRKLPQ